MTLEDLNAEHAIADQLRFIAGRGGLPLIQVRNAHAEAVVSLHGAQVLSFRPRGASADVLFVSERAHFQSGKAIRGGVPICWPWFGADPQGLGRPSHGLARTRLWSVRDTATTPEGDTHITLDLMDTPETMAIWPHAFQLTLQITVGATLRLALTTRNTGETPFAITQALHSYFTVGDIAQTTVTGLDGCHYTDKAAGGAVKPQAGAVAFAAEVDRIYAGAPAELAVEDRALQRVVRIRAEGSHTAVVWNPWATLAASMADLEDDDYLRFACVETANAGDEVVTLPPGGEHRLAAAIALSPMG
ncbi:MAG: D-hexose-6-phosphate mutarotase [Hydrogenophaga sp.]|uniref:D-hexose-6-phosphate mutarotase n=1 Tax=Hydrogenophaga sp. TaxID=1904254 RepID=UPI0025C70A22|nr:D-hexose-6-phosphate mutarotase [Hydrogenophaga sp.]MBT9552553.1 D-hexose-6-phosphate mutarotase [Hydrogenophaga sp.]